VGQCLREAGTETVLVDSVRLNVVRLTLRNRPGEKASRLDQVQRSRGIGSPERACRNPAIGSNPVALRTDGRSEKFTAKSPVEARIVLLIPRIVGSVRREDAIDRRAVRQ